MKSKITILSSRTRVPYYLSLLIFLLLGCEQLKYLPAPEAYFIAIIVNDMENSINWYSKILGFEVLNRIESKERGFKLSNLKRGNILIELIALDSSISENDLLKSHPKGTRTRGVFKFGFRVAKFEKWIDHLKQSKVDFNGTIVTDKLSGKRC